MFLGPRRPTMPACPDCTSPRTTVPTPSSRSVCSGCSSECCSTSRSRWRWRFSGPAKIYDRFGTLDPTKIAAIEPGEFVEKCTTPPALHRHGRSMAERVQKLAAVRDDYDGGTHPIWATDDAADSLQKVRETKREMKAAKKAAARS